MHRSVIIGDSIVKGLDKHKLSRSTKQNIGVRCFPRATIHSGHEGLLKTNFEKESRQYNNITCGNKSTIRLRKLWMISILYAKLEIKDKPRD